MGEIGVGLIGTGFMGKCHATAWRTVRAVFGNVPDVRLEVLCDTPEDKAHEMAAQFGFGRATADWQELVKDPAVDVVSITAPNGLHHPIAMAALAAGKHVWCEKPMALTLAQAEEMTQAAASAGTQTLVGYNYLANPAYTNAQRLVAEGAIGRPIHFRGVFDEDYQADADLPWSWRCLKSEAGLGALGDMACHLVSCAVGIMGPVESLVADMQTVHQSRAKPDGTGDGPVENEDIASALVRFRSGAQGFFGTARTAWGRKNHLAWEVHGDRGMITFTQERMNELKLFRADDDPGEWGFRTILTGPQHPPFGQFCPAPGHNLGFNEMKVIELAGLLRAIRDGGMAAPSFSDALEFERVIHGVAEAAETGHRITLT